MEVNAKRWHKFFSPLNILSHAECAWVKCDTRAQCACVCVGSGVLSTVSRWYPEQSPSQRDSERVPSVSEVLHEILCSTFSMWPLEQSPSLRWQWRGTLAQWRSSSHVLQDHGHRGTRTNEGWREAGRNLVEGHCVRRTVTTYTIMPCVPKITQRSARASTCTPKGGSEDAKLPPKSAHVTTRTCWSRTSRFVEEPALRRTRPLGCQLLEDISYHGHRLGGLVGNLRHVLDGRLLHLSMWSKPHRLGGLFENLRHVLGSPLCRSHTLDHEWCWCSMYNRSRSRVFDQWRWRTVLQHVTLIVRHVEEVHCLNSSIEAKTLCRMMRWDEMIWDETPIESGYPAGAVATQKNKTSKSQDHNHLYNRIPDPAPATSGADHFPFLRLQTMSLKLEETVRSPG